MTTTTIPDVSLITADPGTTIAEVFNTTVTNVRVTIVAESNEHSRIQVTQAIVDAVGTSTPSVSSTATVTTLATTLPPTPSTTADANIDTAGDGVGTGTVIVIIVLALLLMALLITGAVFIAQRVRRRRKSHGVYKPQMEEVKARDANPGAYVPPPNSIEGLI